jgi:hypothetical protein
MIKVGAVRKARKLTRICVVLGVILLFSSIGITLTSAAPNENPPGQDQCDDGHGANDKPCKTDPAAGHGQDCEEHGNGGVNEDHCASDGGTTGGSTGGSSTGEGTGGATGNSTGGSSTGEGTGNATGNSTGEGTSGNSTGNATGNSTGEGTGNATGNSTGNATGNSTGNATGNSTGEGTTGETTGSTTGGSSTGTSTGTPVVDDNKIEDEVLGRVVERAPLATTGSTTTVLAVFGIALLMIGSFLRFGRFGTSVTK